MPRPEKNIRNTALLSAALEGLELQKQRIEEQIQEVRSLLGKGTGRRGRPPATAANNNNKQKRGPSRLSAAARRRIAAAQKRRWAEYRKSASAKAG
jgi:hypothetical protein